MVLIRCIKNLLESNSHFVQEFKHTWATEFTSSCLVGIPEWQLSEARLTACSYLSYSVKYSQRQPHLETCQSATQWAIQSLAPRENCSSSSSWFLLSYFNFSWPAATSYWGTTLPCWACGAVEAVVTESQSLSSRSSDSQAKFPTSANATVFLLLPLSPDCP